MGQIPENGKVLSGDNTEVDAKYLTYRGAEVWEPDGSSYVVAADFDFDNFIEKYRLVSAQIQMATSPGGVTGIAFYQMAVAYILLCNFKTCGPDELQRAYNGERHYDRDGFVDAFTPVASFVYGVAAAILEAPEDECYLGGGAQNLYNKYLRDNDEQDGIIDQMRKLYNKFIEGEDDDSIGNPDIDDSGALWNNPNNVMHIRAGYNFVDYYVHCWGLSEP